MESFDFELSDSLMHGECTVRCSSRWSSRRKVLVRRHCD